MLSLVFGGFEVGAGIVCLRWVVGYWYFRWGSLESGVSALGLV